MDEVKLLEALARIEARLERLEQQGDRMGQHIGAIERLWSYVRRPFASLLSMPVVETLMITTDDESKVAGN